MKYLLFALFFIISTGAKANVTYEWQVVDNKTPYDMQFRMTFTDAIVSAGHLAMHMGPNSTVDQAYDLLDLRYNTRDPNVGIWFAPAAYTIGPWSILDVDLYFLENGMLSGRLYANNSETDIRMESDADLFAVTWANSDRGMTASGCTPFSNCAGATGQFVQTEIPDNVATVPEPAGLALTGLGLLAFLGVRRFRK